MDFEDVRVIEAPAERVWAILTDVERWPDWTPTMQEIVRLDAGPFRVGSSARIIQPGGKPQDWTVTELEEGRSFSWQTSTGGVRLIGRHLLTAAPNGTRTVNALTLAGPLGPIAGLILGRRTRRAITVESEALARRVDRPF